MRELHTKEDQLMAHERSLSSVEGYTRLEGEPDLEMQFIVNTNRPEGQPPNDTKIEIKDIDLDSPVKNKLMNPEEFKGLSTQTRTDIMEAVQIEMNLFQDIPADQLANGLRYLILKNPELRQEIKRGNGRDLFTMQTDEFDRFFKSGGSALLQAGANIADPCSNPFFCLMSAEAEVEVCLCLCATASLCIGCWATGRPAVMTCNSHESTTTKALKLLIPVGSSATVAGLMYRSCADSLGDWGERNNMSRGTGQGVGIFLAAWATYLVTSWIGSSMECTEQKNDAEANALRAYLRQHPVDAKAQAAITSSNIERLLVNYKREGDRNPLVRQFSRTVLNEWINRLEAVQHSRRLQQIEGQEVGRVLAL